MWLAFNDNHVELFIAAKLVFWVCIAHLAKYLVFFCFVSSFCDIWNSFTTFIAILSITELSQVICFPFRAIYLLSDCVWVINDFPASRIIFNRHIIDISEQSFRVIFYWLYVYCYRLTTTLIAIFKHVHWIHEHLSRHFLLFCHLFIVCVVARSHSNFAVCCYF